MSTVIFTYGAGTYAMPGSLHEIEYQQFVGYYNAYGADLVKRRLHIVTLENPDEKELEMTMVQLDEAFAYVSYFTGIPINDLQENADVGSLLNVYALSQMQIANEGLDPMIEGGFYFDSAHWEINSPLHSVTSDGMTQQEFSDSMNLARYMIDFAENKNWAAVHPLLCAYFRQEGEAYTHDLIEEGGDRWTLFNTLPMDYVVAVITFLDDSLLLFVQNLNDFSGTYVTGE